MIERMMLRMVLMNQATIMNALHGMICVLPTQDVELRQSLSKTLSVLSVGIQATGQMIEASKEGDGK